MTTPITRWLKRVLPHTLLGRSLLIIVMPLLLVQVISTWVFYDRHWYTMTKRLALGVAGDIAMAIDQRGLARTDAERDQLQVLAQWHTELRLEFHKGEILPNKSVVDLVGSLDDILRDAIRDRVRRPFQINWPESGERDIGVQVQLADGVLEATVPRQRLFSSTTYIFILWMVGSSLVLFAVATVFMRNQVRPIRRLAIAADRFGKGRDVPDFRLEGAIEVRQAAAAFLEMRDRIRRQLQQRTDMLSGVSHDLRTPLTRMKLQLAMLGSSPEVDDLKTDVTEMETMIEGYLAFARGEGGETPVPTEINELLGDVVAAARREGTRVELDVDGAINLPVRPQAFRRSIGNLIANAGRYGKRVWVSAARLDDAVEILIDDDGPGIPPEQREEVFRPFFRLEASRNLETGGVGLGLTIARDVLRGHGGELTLDDSPRGGLRACVRLPA
jgi:two-component system osmolarity sensor histidine kinase EnvZ